MTSDPFLPAFLCCGEELQKKIAPARFLFRREFDLQEEPSRFTKKMSPIIFSLTVWYYFVLMLTCAGHLKLVPPAAFGRRELRIRHV
jgi:hypothetical protein